MTKNTKMILLNAEYEAGVIIFSIKFESSFTIANQIYRKKKTATNLILIILFIVGSFYSLSEIFEAFTSSRDADELGDFFTVFLSIIILIIGVTAYFEQKLRESEQKLYILNKNLEKEVEERTRELKEIDQIREDFVRRISHELKTPLISIYSSSQYLLDSYDELIKSDILRTLKVINRGGDRLKDLIDNFLAVYDIESKRFGLQKKKENLKEIIIECVNDMELLLKERNIVLKLDIKTDFFIDIDKIKIEQVILNLLSNALKNTPPKGFIYIGLKKTNNCIDITIRDTGIGFTETEKEYAFKKFGKIERHVERKEIITEGSGLGLYISKEIVKLHNGEIWLESEGRNKGSTFIVRLPLSENNNYP